MEVQRARVGLRRFFQSNLLHSASRWSSLKDDMNVFIDDHITNSWLYSANYSDRSIEDPGQLPVVTPSEVSFVLFDPGSRDGIQL